MKKILNVKSWLLRKAPQFRMEIPRETKSTGVAIRIKDEVIFSSDGRENSKIYYNNRKGEILDFTADYVHVQIELKKADAPDYDGIEFDDENYEYIEVPINDIEPRGFVSPGVFTKEYDNSNPAPMFVR